MAYTKAKAKQITYKNDGVGSVVRDLHDKLGEFVSVKDFGAVGDGVTDDTIAIQNAINSFPIIATSTGGTTYRNGIVMFPPGKYKVTDTIMLQAGVSLIGQTKSGRYYIPGVTNNTSFGTTILLDNTSVEPGLQYTGELLASSCLSIEGITFSQSVKTEIASSALKITNGFLLSIRNCVFTRLGYHTAISGGSSGLSSNGIFIDNCQFTYLGDNASTTGGAGFTYGNAIDFSYVSDSSIINCFIETNGGTGITTSGGNNRIINCFIDMNRHGILITGGDRVTITNTNVKWNWLHGIYISGALERSTISNCIVMGNNYVSNTVYTSAGYGIKLGANKITNLCISGCNIVDDYIGTAHATYKTVKQGSIDFGTNLSNSVMVSNCMLSDVDPAWDSQLQARKGLVNRGDSIQSGRLILNNILFETQSSLPVAGTFTPVVSFNSGTGSATLDPTANKLSYYKNGPVVTVNGQIKIASVTGNTGDLRISGLPFLSVDYTGSQAGASVGTVRANFILPLPAPSTSNLICRIASPTTVISIERPTDLGQMDDVASYITTNTTLSISVSYFTEEI